MTDIADRQFGEPATARRLRPFGESIFTTMSALAVRHSAINLGQGFPDFEPPEFVRSAAKRALDGGFSQYGRSFGLPEVNRVLSRQLLGTTGNEYDPDLGICVTAGCTEAIAAAMLGLLDPGDEVVMMDPCYDSYAACVVMAGGVPRRIALSLPGFRIDEATLRGACSTRTRAILLNSPHNPTGRIFDEEELAAVARIATDIGCIVISDEVYEWITFTRKHLSIASLPGMSARTLVLSSLGKTFSCTGFKVGWAAGPNHLVAAVRAAHQFLTFCSATPLQQSAIAAFANLEEYLPSLRSDYLRRRDQMVHGLQQAGFSCITPEGSYFIVAEHGHLGLGTDIDAAQTLVREARVATIPVSAFYGDPAANPHFLRVAFCKSDETISEACRRLQVYSRRRGQG
ncbi:MAG: aminotransferase class I/II-fold pyridoxal phosphate-dependent enzyme [Phycisphaerales bacterium]|nr:aminotransferase class I/II-fold pyridoxal phosphate-dependent enzyme [Phycisphaerales bacterium]